MPAIGLAMEARERARPRQGRAILRRMVLDTLSGRSPLYRLEEFFKHQDTQLLLGQDVDPTSFNDTTVARAIDAIFEIGAEKVFSEVAFNASCRFPLNKRYVPVSKFEFEIGKSKIINSMSIYL